MRSRRPAPMSRLSPLQPGRRAVRPRAGRVLPLFALLVAALALAAVVVVLGWPPA